jgi:hypothetical protein
MHTQNEDTQDRGEMTTQPTTNVNVKHDERVGESTFPTGTSNHADTYEQSLAEESLALEQPMADETDNVVIGEDEIDEVEALEDDPDLDATGQPAPGARPDEVA